MLQTNSNIYEKITFQLTSIYSKILQHSTYRWLLHLLGLPLTIVCFYFYYVFLKRSNSKEKKEHVIEQLIAAGVKEKLLIEAHEQVKQKHLFFKKEISDKKIDAVANSWANAKFEKLIDEQFNEQEQGGQIKWKDTYSTIIKHPIGLIFSIIIALPMYLLMLLYSNAYVKYTTERLFMTLLVILGVAVLVFTILYISPMNPASNLLGVTATEEQIVAFNKLHGLDQPYLVQLWDNLKGILLLDLGKSFIGNEWVATAIINKFPITIILTVIATILAVIIALPIGIISATKPNSLFDYSTMFVALLCLSIPNFWMGLIFILNFAIKLSWLPASFNPTNWVSAIMPIIVLGTALMASVARMTRSSVLEVINEDYIITAKAKGLKQNTVLWRHAIGNALIPIITVIGLLFGGMLGGAAVTEKVFNISGIGSYIVDRQFIPDIPAIMGGVVYTAIAISIVNVLVDLLYAFLDPRIRSNMKQSK